MLENTDSVRHDLMIPGLDPMFTLEFRGPGRPERALRHARRGRHARLSLPRPDSREDGDARGARRGPGRSAEEEESALEPASTEGEGVVVSVDLRKSRIVVDHKEIPGFMAAMAT